MKSEYRNSIRSRRLICEALLQLLDEKPLEKVTVTDIAHRADISRGTFYLHYDSVRSVIRDLYDTYLSHMDQFFETLDTPVTLDTIPGITTACLRFIYRQHPEQNILLLLHRQNSFADSICLNFQKRILEVRSVPQDRESRSQIIIRANLLIHGILGAFRSVADGSPELTVEDLSAALDRMEQDLRTLESLRKDEGRP